MAKHVVPTVRQKLKIYKLAKSILIMNQLKLYAAHCICSCIIDAQQQLGYKSKVYSCKWRTGSTSLFIVHAGNDMPHNFPELYAYKPVDKPCGVFWWQYNTEVGQEIRINVLDEIILALEESLRIENANKKAIKNRERFMIYLAKQESNL